MKAFFKRLEARNARREAVVKESLSSQLLAAVKEVQVYQAGCDHLEEEQRINEATSYLITTLEAVFIHGLKETLADRVAIAIANPDQMPEPNFWPPLMVFSHRHIIKQILKMSQITTDVGRCRSWIRLALNDSLLLSYFEAIARQNNALNPYYKKSAFLRDTESLALAISSLEGLSSITFSLPTNSSLLNAWTDGALLLAGLWSAPMKCAPAIPGTDVARTLKSGTEEAEDAVSLASFQESLVGSGKLALSEEEALRIILGTPVDGSPLLTRASSEASLGSDQQTLSQLQAQPQLQIQLQNKLEQADESAPLPPPPPPPLPPPPSSPIQSYHSLLKNYTPSTADKPKPPDLQDLLQRFESFPTKSPSPDSSGSDDAVTRMGYEVINESPLSIKTPEFRNMIEHLTRIMQEPGLDTQNYTCSDCGQPIGISFTKPRVCALTGAYYCTDCFGGVEWLVPGRVVLNWDFARYEVSAKAGKFLSEVQYHPLIDVRRVNPKLYLAVDEMAALQKMRLRLNLLHGYLLTCREPIMKRLQKQVWPREYLYEHVHLYSLADFCEIVNGQLAQLLEKLIKFSEEHVMSCCLCSQKGFFCEICKDPNVIYPFNLDTSYRCLPCKGVFHKSCKEKTELCPKCVRKKKRQAELLQSEDLQCNS